MSENLKVGQLQPIYPAKEHEHMRALLDFAVEEYGDDTAFILKKKPASRKEQPTYKKVTYKELREDVRRLGTGLMAMGVRNARIAIIGENSVIEAGAAVGTAPDGSEDWGVATCGPNVTVAPGHQVPAGAMIYPGEEA